MKSKLNKYDKIGSQKDKIVAKMVTDDNTNDVRKLSLIKDSLKEDVNVKGNVVVKTTDGHKTEEYSNLISS